MEQSILKSTKKGLQIADDDDSFDLDVVTQINSAFSTLNDLGVGPKNGFIIDDDGEATWDDFLPAPADDPEDAHKVQQSQVKNFLLLTVRLNFDPPQSAYLLESMQRQLAELTFRISVRRENEEWAEPVPAEEDPVVFDAGDAG